jgi:hypothetical protein
MRTAIFDENHLALIRRALEDEAAYQALLGALERLAGIVKEARRRAHMWASCSLRPKPLAIELRFSNGQGKSYRVSLSFKRAYEASGRRFTRRTALNLRLAVESLVLSVKGMKLATSKRRGQRS